MFLVSLIAVIYNVNILRVKVSVFSQRETDNEPKPYGNVRICAAPCGVCGSVDAAKN